MEISLKKINEIKSVVTPGTMWELVRLPRRNSQMDYHVAMRHQHSKLAIDIQLEKGDLLLVTSLFETKAQAKKNRDGVNVLVNGNLQCYLFLRDFASGNYAQIK